MKKAKRARMLLALFLLAAIVTGIVLFLRRDTLPGWEPSEYISAAAQIRTRDEILRAAEACRDLYIGAEKLPPEYSGGDQRLRQADIDAIEERLAAAGFATLDSDEIYPTYLENPEELRGFWEAVSDGENAVTTVIRVSEHGGFQHLLFSWQDGKAFYVLTDLGWDAENGIYVREAETRPIYDMELADWGIFYYQIYPEDPHYINYSQIRMEAVDREQYDMTRKYILPVGYQFTNLFLCDWQEGAWGKLSFNDLFEFLYEQNTGEVLDSGQFSYQQGPTRAIIPAALFEETILPWFSISTEEFRTLSQYDAERDCYLWRPRFGEDVTAWKYPMCEPLVTDWTQNSDGTLTMTVQVYSPDLKTDSLFTHQVTVRPLENGKFQYAANRVTNVSDRGLPPSMPRFELDGP